MVPICSYTILDVIRFGVLLVSLRHFDGEISSVPQCRNDLTGTSLERWFAIPKLVMTNSSPRLSHGP